MEFLCKNEKETYALASKVAKVLHGGDILILKGDLGAGKTTFTKGIAKALKIKENVTSPTFTLMNSYTSGKIKLFHFDMYRIVDESEAEEIGLNDYFFSDGVSVVEWPENIKNLIPSKHLTIEIEKVDENTRKFVLNFDIMEWVYEIIGIWHN